MLMTAATSAYLNQPTRSLAEAAYETDRHARPLYDDGTPRPPWERLGFCAQLTWERNPSPRWTL